MPKDPSDELWEGLCRAQLITGAWQGMSLEEIPEDLKYEFLGLIQQYEYAMDEGMG